MLLQDLLDASEAPIATPIRKYIKHVDDIVLIDFQASIKFVLIDFELLLGLVEIDFAIAAATASLAAGCFAEEQTPPGELLVVVVNKVKAV
ncbi:689_t:CDS:2 [Ambispora gerdemannii]|uniref:689_t:CDS:1 n=1 Tax=Ambispora gerdemannii TaxID=144530 RepID=A0A9N9ACN9_9GLOM|nr:689_t:CDS:2 [Ambispora gerdemannii]